MKKIKAFLYPTPREVDAVRIIREKFAELIGVPSSSFTLSDAASDLSSAIEAADLDGLWDDAGSGHKRRASLDPGYGKSQTVRSKARSKTFGPDTPASGIPLWTTHKGLTYRVQDMATQHLFYAYRMIYNHTVAPAFRIGEFKRYRDVFDWPAMRARKGMRALEDELYLRKDKSAADGGLETELKDQFADIQRNRSALRNLGLL